ncbi:MAG: DUF366 family protein [Desulfotomaculales bacterium]
MHIYFHEASETYDGRQLSSLWAFRRFGLQGDSIVSFVGPCQVTREALVDLADAREGSVIYSRKMLHFVVEHFDLDLEKAVLRQRLLTVIALEVIGRRTGALLTRNGDDLYCKGRKLSVSIATLSPVSSLIHMGLNIDAEGAPVPAAGLLDLGLGEADIPLLARDVMQAYAEEMTSVHLARCKVRGVS